MCFYSLLSVKNILAGAIYLLDIPLDMIQKKGVMVWVKNNNAR